MIRQVLSDRFLEKILNIGGSELACGRVHPKSNHQESPVQIHLSYLLGTVLGSSPRPVPSSPISIPEVPRRTPRLSALAKFSAA